MFKKSSTLAKFAQLQFNSMNICLFSTKLPILVKICRTVIKILTFDKRLVYRFQKRAFVHTIFTLNSHDFLHTMY